MNKKLRGMIDEIFSDMKMTADNLAIRDELMANAASRYEDALAAGKSEEEAFNEVASSLEDVRATLAEMNKKPETEDKKNPTEPDFADAVSKAFDALGKWAQQADEATGKMFSGFGKAVGKGAVEVGRVAGETFEKISKNIQEATGRRELTEEELLARAKEIRIQAEIRQAADDQEGARQLRRKAYEMEMQAEVLRAKKEAKSTAAETGAEPAAAEPEVKTETSAGEDKGEEPVPEMENAAQAPQEVDQSALDAEVDRIMKEVDAETKPEAEKEGIHLEDAPEDTVVVNRFDAELVKRIEINLEADDIEIVPSDSWVIETEWDGGKEKAVQPSVTLKDGVLKVGRQNPDLFKTFFSLFQKDGGKLVVRMPVRRMVSYNLNTTSGDIVLDNVLAEEIRAGNTSGKIRINPAHGCVAGNIQLNSVSGVVEVNAETEKISLTNVSGNICFAGNADEISCNTVTGKIQLEGSAKSYSLESVSGNAVIECQNPNTERIKASSVSGSLKIVLPSDIRGFKVNMAGLSRQVSNEFGKNAYGTCELPIRFDSMSGRLLISGWGM